MAQCITKLLVSRGATVSIADVNEKGLKTTIESLDGDKHIYTVVDVSKSAEVNAWIEKTVHHFGKLDCAVNFAGVIGSLATIKDETDEGFDRTMNVNARGVFNCLRAELQWMKKGGSIV